jgi:hypothetical protein
MRGLIGSHTHTVHLGKETEEDVDKMTTMDVRALAKRLLRERRTPPSTSARGPAAARARAAVTSISQERSRLLFKGTPGGAILRASLTVPTAISKDTLSSARALDADIERCQRGLSTARLGVAEAGHKLLLSAHKALGFTTEKTSKKVPLSPTRPRWVGGRYEPGGEPRFYTEWTRRVVRGDGNVAAAQEKLHQLSQLAQRCGSVLGHDSMPAADDNPRGVGVRGEGWERAWQTSLAALLCWYVEHCRDASAGDPELHLRSLKRVVCLPPEVVEAVWDWRLCVRDGTGSTELNLHDPTLWLLE